MKTILLILLSISLAGCGTFCKREEVPGITPEVVHINKEALEPCVPLKEDIQVSTFDQFISIYGDLATQYGKCSNKQAGSIKLLKQFGNIK